MSNRHCEAMVWTGRVWTRCGRQPTDLHHRLTRARGGLILDAIGETIHHLYLCRQHHMVAHDEGSAFENGLLIDGYVTTEQGRPVYRGSHELLTARYGPLQVQ